MIRRHPSSTRTDTLFPYTPLFRSEATRSARLARCAAAGVAASAAPLATTKTRLRRIVVECMVMAGMLRGSGVFCFCKDNRQLTGFPPAADVVYTGCLLGGVHDLDATILGPARADARRVGKECVSTCRFW